MSNDTPLARFMLALKIGVLDGMTLTGEECAILYSSLSETDAAGGWMVPDPKAEAAAQQEHRRLSARQERNFKESAAPQAPEAADKPSGNCAGLGPAVAAPDDWLRRKLDQADEPGGLMAAAPGPDFNTEANLHADTVAERYDASPAALDDKPVPEELLDGTEAAAFNAWWDAQKTGLRQAFRLASWNAWLARSRMHQSAIGAPTFDQVFIAVKHGVNCGSIDNAANMPDYQIANKITGFVHRRLLELLAPADSAAVLNTPEDPKRGS